MYEFRITTSIAAPLATCFDLARSVDAHLESAAGTGERVVGGKLSGLLELGDEVTWEAKHFGITQRLSSKITAYRPRTFFQDRMTRGAFRFLEHDHFFEPEGDGTLMIDVMRFQAPLGPLGWIAERILLAPHLREFLTTRGLALKAMAERATRSEAMANLYALRTDAMMESSDTPSSDKRPSTPIDASSQTSVTSGILGIVAGLLAVPMLFFGVFGTVYALFVSKRANRPGGLVRRNPVSPHRTRIRVFLPPLVRRADPSTTLKS